jgi:hypothetical protein
MGEAQPSALISTAYDEPVRFALLQQVPAALLCLLVLDGGLMAKVCGGAMAGFWVGAGWLWARRPRNPSPTDIAFIRWGFFPLLAASLVLAAIVQRWSGA